MASIIGTIILTLTFLFCAFIAVGLQSIIKNCPERLYDAPYRQYLAVFMYPFIATILGTFLIMWK